ncbi:hypothetical protein SmJEL517_g00141 [Synchytrium microbalum]|uniref:tRNA pseudouridine synthase 1 n=1 Tax=Synchytrium microbalum TaxID=1806994 RepID=A0A507CIZ2_9FUNG|nr:uncharacterized protein SmJEL517_g00141 [Synchytrium microbalum]TPX38144.1 hypothetical protein SmJEL517_g00141 [Synchytrium microbalum]
MTVSLMETAQDELPKMEVDSVPSKVDSSAATIPTEVTPLAPVDDLLANNNMDVTTTEVKVEIKDEPNIEANTSATAPDAAPVATSSSGNALAGTKRERDEDGEEGDDASNKQQKLAKHRYAILFGYNGKKYHGLQMHDVSADAKELKTIESELLKAMHTARLVSDENAESMKKISISRSARTDKGVSACRNLIAVKIKSEEVAIKTVNELLPPEIRVWNLLRVVGSFDARRTCEQRSYEYFMPTYVFAAPHPSSNFELRGGRCETKIVNELGHVIGKVDGKGNFVEDIVPGAEGIYKHLNTKTQKTLMYEPLDITPKTPEELLLHRQRRAAPEELAKFKEIMRAYLGTRNFWNYTVGTKFADASATRVMIEIEVNDPEVIKSPKGVEVEWIRIKIHGQSFQLHQIRKMMAMAILAVRTGTPTAIVLQSFSRKRVTIPKAPGVGLLLNSLFFNRYNADRANRRKQAGWAEIDYTQYDEKIESFKREHIHTAILADEEEKNTWEGWTRLIDRHSVCYLHYLNKEGEVLNNNTTWSPRHVRGQADEEMADKEEDEEDEKVGDGDG